MDIYVPGFNVFLEALFKTSSMTSYMLYKQWKIYTTEHYATSDNDKDTTE